MDLGIMFDGTRVEGGTVLWLATATYLEIRMEQAGV